MIDFNQCVLLNESPAFTPKSEVESGLDSTTASLMEFMVTLEEEFFEINKEHMIATHAGIVSESPEIITEGFKDMMHSAVEFFKKLIKKITDFFKKTFLTINSYLGDFNKFINKNKEFLRGLDPDFTIQGYEYSIDDAPDLKPLEDLVDSYMRSISSVEDITKSKIDEEKDAFNKNESIDKLRASILKESGKITSDSFDEDVKKHFRKGDTDAQTINVNSSRLNKAIDSYSDINKNYKDSVKMKNKTIMLLSNIQTFFEKGAAVGYSGNDRVIKMKGMEINNNKLHTTSYASEIKDNSANQEIISKYYNMKFSQAKIISGIVTKVTTEKVVALKECLKQEREIVRKSMSYKKKDDSSKEGDK